MSRIRRTIAICCMLSCFLQVEGADKYTDENRPYEFGFTIDGEQHRHEEKDEKGIIKGEFGFITADGVYHVTVYATDENGNFKILSMKNIRVKPYPTAPVKKGHSLPFPPSQQQPVTQRPTPEPISLEPPIRSCSHCSIPTTKKPQLNDFAVVARDPNTPQYPQNPPVNPPVRNDYNQQIPLVENDSNPQYPQDNYQQNPAIPNDNYQQNPPVQNDYYQPNQPNANYPQDNYNIPEQNVQPPYGSAGERNPKQFTDYPPQYQPQPEYPLNPNQPTLISAQMQIVDKNTDIYQRGPGEKEGLPPGIDKKDVMMLLYTFNYTVGFHGHYEEGYTNGAKKGYYFVTGRNGVRQRVDYVADEKGFRPKITQEVLDVLSDDVPKPETEKSDKYGLKGYEFKWLYYPVESKKR